MKLYVDGLIKKYKVYFIVKCFLRKQKVDFNTFAPMTRILSICILFILTYIFKLFVHQINVKITFLNGILEEEIYMEQPKGCKVLRKRIKFVN